jgi:hypothetical protein
VGEVDAVERLDERGDEMAPRLLAVADDVDPGLLLVGEHEAHGIALALGQRISFEPPWRPQLPRFGKPGGLRKTARDRRLQKLGHRRLRGSLPVSRRGVAPALAGHRL